MTTNDGGGELPTARGPCPAPNSNRRLEPVHHVRRSKYPVWSTSGPFGHLGQFGPTEQLEAEPLGTVQRSCRSSSVRCSTSDFHIKTCIPRISRQWLSGKLYRRMWVVLRYTRRPGECCSATAAFVKTRTNSYCFLSQPPTPSALSHKQLCIQLYLYSFRFWAYTSSRPYWNSRERSTVLGR